MKDHILFFIPGILGTELYYEGPGMFKENVIEPVWTGNLSTLWDTVAKSPERLHSSVALRPGRILRKIKILPFLPKIKVYGPIYDYLTETLNYKEGSDLITYGYDWRQSNMRTAQQLAIFARNIASRTNKPLKFIGHSMGGLIIRLLLSDPSNMDLTQKTKCVIQIGTPVRGSSKAFHTLRKHPSFNTIFDSITRLEWMIDPIAYKNFMVSLQSFESLFELLPPDSEYIVSTVADDHFSALDGSLWPATDRKHLDEVKEIHSRIKNFKLSCLITIYSSGIPTEREYVIDHRSRIIAYGRPVWGDGTVSVASAALSTDPSNCRHVDADVQHDALPNYADVLSMLAAELSK